MASVLVLLETFIRKGAAALGFFPCATAPCFFMLFEIWDFDYFLTTSYDFMESQVALVT